MKLNGQTALITGASSGIGLELARRFAQAGCNLILVARSEQALHDLASELSSQHQVLVDVIVQDLAQPSAADDIYKQVQQLGRSVDILVNNAGFGLWGRFDTTPIDKELNMLQVNIVALTHLTKLFLPGMVHRRRGKVLNVASTAAFQPGPMMAAYFASKAYVLSFTEALANEMEGTGVSVSCLCPGPTHTGFEKTASPYKIKLFEKAMSVTATADLAFRGLMDGKSLIITGAMNRFLAMLPRFFPRRQIVKVVRGMMEAKKS
jgi:short-subunit dehydrogenase